MPREYKGDEVDVFALGAIMFGMMSFKPIATEKATQYDRFYKYIYKKDYAHYIKYVVHTSKNEGCKT